jgi:hypothetical protein
VGFFVSPLIAITVSHNVIERCQQSDGTLLASTLCPVGESVAQELLVFRIVCNNTHLDFIILQAMTRVATDYFTVTSSSLCSELLGCQRVALLRCGIAMSDETSADLPISLTTVPATVCHTGKRHFGYSTPTYDGDSGAALFFGRDRCVVGMHLEGIKRAREEFEQKESLTDAAGGGGISPAASPVATGVAGGTKRRRATESQAASAALRADVDSVKFSIRGIISSVKTGGLALFLGAAEVKDALAAAITASTALSPREVGSALALPASGAGSHQHLCQHQSQHQSVLIAGTT